MLICKVARTAAAVLALLACTAMVVSAQEGYADKKEMPKMTGFRADMLHRFGEDAEKALSLAEATPQEKFTWRPAEGVRSVSEVYMHITGANMFFPTFIGGKMPEGMDFAKARKLEKETTAKKDVINYLKESIKGIQDLVANMEDSDLDKEADLFGTKTTYRGVLLLLCGHLSEHLGQSIAYARMNDVTPPWSQQSGGTN